MMAYIKSFNLEDEKMGFIALSNAIKGIGQSLAKQILTKCNINHTVKVKDWDPSYSISISNYLDQHNILIAESLDEFEKSNIYLLKRIKHRRGIRLEKGLPLYGKGGKTAKKLNAKR